MLVCPLSIFTALALVSVVGEKGKTGVKQLKKGTPTAEPGPRLF